MSPYRIRVAAMTACVAATVLPMMSCATGNAAPAASRPSWKSTGTYTSTFDDEFNGTTLARRRWSAGWYPAPDGSADTAPVNHDKSSPSWEDACYSPDAKHLSVKGGYLSLTLTRTASSCKYDAGPKVATYHGRYTGAMIQSRDHFTQVGGSFEARVCLPAAATSPSKVGGFPSWWLNAIDTAEVSGYPDRGEIDIVEGLEDGSTQAHTHFRDTDGTDFGNKRHLSSAKPLVGCHNFGASWNRAKKGKNVTFYYDGRSIGSLPMPAQNPEFLAFINTIGNESTPATKTSVMKVDWVRVWKQA